MKRFRSLLACLVGLVAVLGIVVGVAPGARAYGNNTQWQTGFSGNFGTSSGFWGWCAFGGSSPDGLSGSFADCQIANYFFKPITGLQDPFEVDFSATSWVIATGSAFCPSSIPCFFLTGGTAVIQGPGAKVLSILFGVPVGVPFSLSIPCGSSSVPSSLAGSPCDTGVPAMPGHFSFRPVPTVHIEIQVTKIG